MSDLEYLYSRVLVPLHHVRDKAKLDRLVTAMKRRGWTGRPLLGYASDNYPEMFQLLTGSHRLAAAEKLDLAIPVVLMDLTVAEQLELEDQRDDDDRADWLASRFGKSSREAKLMRLEATLGRR